MENRDGRLRRGGSVCLRLMLVLLAAAPAALPRSRGLFIGISRYRQVSTVPSLGFAHLDATQLSALLAPTFSKTSKGTPDMQVLINQDATLAAVNGALKSLLGTEALSNDTVFIFISARGVATRENPDGHLLAYDSDWERAGTSGVSLKALGDLIAGSDARRIFVFADVSRSPAELSKFPNEINFAFRNLGKRKSIFSAILGSKPGELSNEDPDLKHGIFDYFLLQGFGDKKKAITDADGRVRFLELYKFLQGELKKQKKFRQEPWTWDDKPPGPYVSPVARGVLRFEPLLAFFGPPNGFLAGFQQEPASTDSEPLRRLRLSIEAGNIDGIRAAVDDLKRAATAEEQLQAAVELETAGQRTVLRYGEGNQFPDDPLRPGRADFKRASDLFGLALAMRAGLPPGANPAEPEFEERLRTSIEARMRFCLARALELDDTLSGRYAAALAELQRLDQTKWIAESWNVKGIAHLEQGQYEEAAPAFRNAIQLAPDWAYARHNLALTYVESGDTAAAEREYRAAIERTPYHPYLHYNLGVLLHRLNRQKQAEEAYGKAIDAFILQIERHQAAADPAGAGSPEDKARAQSTVPVLTRNEGQVHNALGALLQAKRKLDQAENEYKASLGRDSQLAAAMYNLGSLYAIEKYLKRDPARVDEAIRLLSGALEQDKTMLPARVKLGEAYRIRAEASKDAEPAVEDLRRAEAEFSEVLRSQPESNAAKADLNEIRGDLEKVRNNLDGACSAWQSAAGGQGVERETGKRIRGKIKRYCRGR